MKRILCILRYFLVFLFFFCPFFVFAYEPHDDIDFEISDDFKLESYADITMNTDYIIRGLSFSDHHTNVQGAFGVKSMYGFFAQLFTAGQDFNIAGGGVATINTTFTVGYHGDRENYDYSIIFNDYLFPDATEYNYWEIISIFHYYLLEVQVGYTPHWWGLGDTGVYSFVGVNIPLEKYTESRLRYFTIGAHIGLYEFEGPVFGGSDYNDYEVYFSLKKNQWQAKLKWTDTNGGFGGNIGDSQIVGVLTYATY